MSSAIHEKDQDHEQLLEYSPQTMMITPDENAGLHQFSNSSDSEYVEINTNKEAVRQRQFNVAEFQDNLYQKETSQGWLMKEFEENIREDVGVMKEGKQEEEQNWWEKGSMEGEERECEQIMLEKSSVKSQKGSEQCSEKEKSELNSQQKKNCGNSNNSNRTNEIINQSSLMDRENEESVNDNIEIQAEENIFIDTDPYQEQAIQESNQNPMIAQKGKGQHNELTQQFKNKKSQTQINATPNKQSIIHQQLVSKYYTLQQQTELQQNQTDKNNQKTNFLDVICIAIKLMLLIAILIIIYKVAKWIDLNLKSYITAETVKGYIEKVAFMVFGSFLALLLVVDRSMRKKQKEEPNMATKVAK